MAYLGTDREVQKSFKIYLLINYTASHVLRKAFQELWFGFRKQEWENTIEDGTDLITGIGKIIYSKEMKIQKDYLASGDINRWDFALLLKMTNHLLGYQVPSPTDDEREKFKDLSTLIPIRNKLAHPGAYPMTDEEFETNWNAISEVLDKFGVTKDELEAVRNFSKPGTKKTTLTTPVNKENTQLAQKLKDEGNKLFKNGDIQGAIDRYSEALLLSNIPIEDQAILYSNRSKAYLDLEISEEVENALEDAKQAINLRPQWWKGYFRTAVAFEYSDEFQQAIKFYNMTLALEPTDKDIERRMKNCQFRRSFKEIDEKYIYRSVHECVEAYLKETSKKQIITKEIIMKTKEKLMTIDSYLGLVIRGHVHREDEKFEEAAEYFTRASERKKENAEALYNLALLKISQKLKNSNVTDALKLLEKAANQLSEGNFGVSESEFILGLYYQEAIRDYNKAFLFYKRSAMSLNGLAANQFANMHEYGIGVIKNRKSAVELWKIAATSKYKIIPAMECLSRHYLEVHDFERAIKWHTTAVESGSENLCETKDAFKSDIEALKISHMNSKMCELLEEREGSQKTEEKKLLKIKIDLAIEIMLKDHFKYNLDDKNIPNSKQIKSSFESNMTIKKLRKAAENGNEMSKILLETHNHYTNAFHILEYENIDDEQSFATAINEMASAIRLERSFIDFPEGIFNELWEKLKVCVPTPDSQESDFDKNLRICYCYLITTFDPSNFDRLIFYAKESAKKYPDEACFPYFVGSMYGFKQDFSEGVKITNKALEFNPSNYSLLYNKAALGMHCQNLAAKTGIQHYLDFIEFAPIGHRKIPEAYYTIALFYREIHITTPNSSSWGKVEEELYENFVKYFELAQQSEKTLAPCYLPYEGGLFKKNAEDYWTIFKMKREIGLRSGIPKIHG